MTGMSVCSAIRFSISKHSGALISSKLIPPKVFEILTTVLMNSSGSSVSTSISKTSISANVFNKSPFPSITGLLASGPIFPSPNTAVPLEITATKFAFEVYRYAASGFSAISRQGYATPGEYAKLSSYAVA